MLTTAFVVSVEGGKALVRMPKPGGCGGSQLFAPKPHEFETVVGDGLRLQPGDAVRLLLPTGASVLSSFLIFILPLLFFAAVYTLVDFLLKSVALACGLGLAAAALSMVAVLGILKKNDRFQPTIVEKVDGFIPPECSGCAQNCFAAEKNEGHPTADD